MSTYRPTLHPPRYLLHYECLVNILSHCWFWANARCHNQMCQTASCKKNEYPMSTVLLHSCSNPYESRSREVARYLTFFYRRTPLDLSPPHGASGCIRQPVCAYRLLQLPFRHFHLPETCVEAFADSGRPSCGSYWRMNEIMPPCLGTTSFLADRGYDAGEPSRCNARSRKGAIIMSITSWVLVPNDETCRLFWLPQNSLLTRPPHA